MNRRIGTVAIALMALTALAGVLSFVFFSQPVPKNSANTATPANEDSSSTSSSSSSETINPDPSEPLPVPNSLPLVAASPRPDQPPKLKPQPPSRSPDWKLLDWSLKPVPEKPGIQLRASSYLAPGKYPFVRVEEEIQILPNGEVKVLRTAEMVGDQIIVKLPKGSAAEEIQSLALKLGGQAAAKPFAPDTWLVALPRKLEAVPEALAGSTNSGISIDYAEPNHLVRPMRTPNDPLMNDFSQWHLYNNSQIDKDIKAPRAWDRRTSAAYGTTNKVIVAVIDSGVRYTHEDLSQAMWKNPGESGGGKETNGIDDDGNGYTDDVHGIDTYENDGDPWDPTSHGTQCAGLIGAVGNNSKGITGVAWQGIEIMALKMFGPNGESPTTVNQITGCIDYASTKGAKVINASFGGTGSNNTIAAAIYRAQTNNVIFVAAAGNDNSNNDSLPFFPASYSQYIISTGPDRGTYPLINIISVGASDRNDKRASFSNYGPNSVDLMAPGVSMWSTTISSDSSYGADQGTSFSAPIVAGAVALHIAEFPAMSLSNRIGEIFSAVDTNIDLSGTCVTGGRLNLAKLLPAADVNTLPAALVWHRPNHLESYINYSPMRTPTTPTLSNTVTIFSGLKKFNNTNGLVNQSGGWLFYRTSSAVSWSSNQLAWHSNSNDYQFWKGTISNVAARTFEYYLQLDFDSGARTTYSYAATNTEGFATTTSAVTAQSSPYTFMVAKASAAVTINGTNQTYNGSARPVSISTTPSGLSTTVTYNGSSSAPTNAGTYTVVATVTDANYEGTATNTLTITKASATISLGNLSQTYDGTARTVTATPTPSDLAISLTYNSSSSAPTNAGTYTVVATVTDPNYEGTATNTLTVAKAAATVTLGDLNQNYNGSARPVSVSTTPPNLFTTITYGGNATVPTNPGSYPILALMNESNYEGSATATLTISGLADPEGDTNGDGIQNLLEYALAANSSGTILPVLSPPTDGVLTLTAIVRTNDEGLTFTAHGVTNLFDYADTNLVSQILGTANGVDTNNVPVGFQRQEFRYTNNAARAFLKLTIQQQ